MRATGIGVGGMNVAKLFLPTYSSPHLTWTFLCKFFFSSNEECGTKVYDLVVGKDELRLLTDRASDAKDLAGFFKIEVSAADAWSEKDEPIYVHPKYP
ncbi:hypothetical protein BDR03DRAFT_963766 [Suillus americanus]|nr:hypothetical protein BDR03DRAFT_963766 [Suillus americanus]